jgi:hypothetical protein
MPASTFQQQQTKTHIPQTNSSNYRRCLVHNPQHHSSVFATAGETGLALMSIIAQTVNTALLYPVLQHMLLTHARSRGNLPQA